MKAIGETFDGEKSLPYLFDIVLRLYRDEKGRFLAECLKDRSNKLPTGQLECSFGLFDSVYDRAQPSRQVEPTSRATAEQKRRIQEQITRIEMAPEQVSRRLAAHGARSLDDLTEQKARLILSKLESAVADKHGA